MTYVGEVVGHRGVAAMLLATTVGIGVGPGTQAASAIDNPQIINGEVVNPQVVNPQVVNPQVVNGVIGDPRDFPALVAIADRDRYRASGLLDAQQCGGAVVAPTTVITAAHCVFDQGELTPARRILVGHTPSGALSDSRAQVVTVAKIRVHPDYDETIEYADIAVIHLTEPLEGVPPMLPALPAEDALLAPQGASVAVAGWGATTSTGRTFPDRFRAGGLVVFPRSACGGGRTFTIDGITFNGYRRGEVDPDSMICAEGVRADRVVDSCIGDSGGPLIAGAGDARRLVGVVSWGPQRCASRYAGVYTRVSAFTAFLRAEGVPFAPTPQDAPQPPAIVDTSITPTSASVTVMPAGAGPSPTRYRVSARDRFGRAHTCTMQASTQPEQPASTCVIEGLTTAVTYAVRAVALIDRIPSEPSNPVSVRPADRPDRPRIASVEIPGNGVAVFGVDRVRANGSPITERVVICTAPDQPRRTGDIPRTGITTVTQLTPGTVYTCRAKVANALGSQRSSPVTVRAR